MADKTQITTGKVRFSYLNVFEARAINGEGDAKYSVTLLIPKSDTKTMAKINEAVKAAKEAYTLKTGRRVPANAKTTMHDGDDDVKPNSGEPYGPECKGCKVINVSSTKKPVLIYNDKTPLTAEDELYSGCYGRAMIRFYYYNTNGNSGISARLIALMKLEDGERLGGGGYNEDDWDE